MDYIIPQDLDWHDKNGGGYLSGHIPCEGTVWCNDWDFPDNDKKDYDVCFRNKIYPQIEELLRNYGELSLIWFDVPITLEEKHSRAIFDLVKKISARLSDQFKAWQWSI